MEMPVINRVALTVTFPFQALTKRALEYRSKGSLSKRPRLIAATVAGLACAGAANLPVTLAAPGDIFNLGTLGGGSSSAFGVNAAGQVTGFSDTAGGANRATHAFLYTGTPGSGGVMHDLGTLNGNYTVGNAINDSGQVAGFSGPPGG